MIYEKVTGGIGTELAEFLDWSETKYVPYTEKCGAKFIGLWVTVTGRTRRFLEMFVFEDFAAYGSVEEVFLAPKTQEDKQVLKELPKYHINSEVEFLRGTSLSPSKGLFEQKRKLE